MFKTSQANIPQIEATIEAFGECYFHGCGNMYTSKEASDFRQKFTNPNSEEAAYRIHFTSVRQVPATVEELNKKLMSSRSDEIVKEKMPKLSQDIKTITVKTAEAPTKPAKPAKAAATLPAGNSEKTVEELEYERLLAEEEALKAKNKI
jgi:hypothetical protein